MPITTADSILVDPDSPPRVYAGVVRDCTPYVYVSEDRGQTWDSSAPLTRPTQYASYCSFPRSLLAIPGQPGTLLVGVIHHTGLFETNPGSIYRSTDYGGHWDRIIPNGTQEISAVHVLAYDTVTPTIVYAGTEGGGMLRSSDGGVSWESVGVGVIDWVLDAVVEPGTHRVFVSRGGLPLYVSDNGGETWAPTGLGGGHNVHDILFAPGIPPVLYDAAFQGLYRSTDGAQSWQPAAGDLGQIPVYSLAAVTATGRVILYAGTAGGVVVLTDTATLLGAGVYRWSSLLPTPRLYLPLAFKDHAP